MPILDIDATDYSVDWDLDETLGAGAFRIAYQKLTSAHKWDSTYYDDIALYRGQANPDVIRVRVPVEGITEQLVVGIADRLGREENAKEGVTGTISGRDLIAFLLDTYPSAASTLQGVTVQLGGTFVYGLTFTQAVSQIAAACGLTAVFDMGGDDYKLGKSIPLTTDRTYAEVLRDLVTPWRWGEKDRLDVWVEGTNLRLARRGLNARGTVQVYYRRIHTDRYEKTVLPSVNDVRVEGMTYDVEEDDIPDGDQPECGKPWTSNYTCTRRTTVTGPSFATSYTEDTTMWYDSRGQLYNTLKSRQYHDLDRHESWLTTAVFSTDTSSAAQTAKLSETEEHRVTDLRGNNNLVNVLVHQRTISWSYDSGSGDTQTEDLTEKEWDEQGNGGQMPLPLTKHRVISYRYENSAGQIGRRWHVTDTDATDNTVTSTFGSSEVLPQRAGRSSVTPAGRKRTTFQISDGPTTARRRESSELIGDTATCATIRSRLIAEHAATKISATFSMAPDLRVKPGMTLQVLDAPVWWDTSNLIVTSVSISWSGRRGSAGMEQTVECVQWL